VQPGGMKTSSIPHATAADLVLSARCAEEASSSLMSGPVGYNCCRSSWKSRNITSHVVHPDSDLASQTPGGGFSAVKQRGVLPFPITVSGNFVPRASTAAMTVIPSFPRFSTVHETDSLPFVAQVQIPGATVHQFVSSRLIILLRGNSSMSN
jgi:hypothetical protein